MVPETPLQFVVAERLSRTFRAKSTGIRLRILEEEWRGKDTSLAHLKMKYDTAFGIRRDTGLSKAEILHLWTRFMKPVGALRIVEDQIKNTLKTEHPPRREALRLHRYEDLPESRAPVRYSPSANYLLLTENGEPDSYSKVLSSKESVQWKKAIIKEIISLKMNEACSLVRLSAGKNALQSLWMFMVKEKQCEKLEGGLNSLPLFNLRF
ncbi:hypothetical protein Tco_0068616 [Tanacetum coccineum]